MDLDFTENKKSYPLIPEDTYQAVFVELEEVGLKQGKFDEEPVPKVVLYFQTEPIAVTDPETGEEKEQRFVLRTFELKRSNNVASGLMKNYIIPIMGGKVDPEVKTTENLIGNNVFIEVVNKAKDGVPTYNNISKVSAVPKKKLRELVAEDYKPRAEKNAESAATATAVGSDTKIPF